jgi:hypothetical protein
MQLKSPIAAGSGTPVRGSFFIWTTASQVVNDAPASSGTHTGRGAVREKDQK